MRFIYLRCASAFIQFDSTGTYFYWFTTCFACFRFFAYFHVKHKLLHEEKRVVNYFTAHSSVVVANCCWLTAVVGRMRTPLQHLNHFFTFPQRATATAAPTANVSALVIIKSLKKKKKD